MKSLFERAEEFIWHNARLIERRLFDFHFRLGSAQAVLSALRAYQNEDGGFGNALEPDIRCPESQPVPTQHALEILDVVGFDEAVVQRICDFLLSITTEEGGVPFSFAFCAQLSARAVVEYRRSSASLVEPYSHSLWRTP